MKCIKGDEEPREGGREKQKKKKKKRLGERERKRHGKLKKKTFYFFNHWLINRVLKTRFPGRHHVEKMPHQTQSDHENRVFET